MPWRVVDGDAGCPVGEPWGVRGGRSDQLVGCHGSRVGALAQVAALEATEVLGGRVSGEVAGRVAVWRALADLDLVAPEGAAREAEKGLAWREEFGRGGTAVGVARARDLVNGARLSPDTVKRMNSYFARHEVDKQGEGYRPGEEGFPSAGRIAWALWGGDPGARWAAKMVEQIRVIEAENR